MALSKIVRKKEKTEESLTIIQVSKTFLAVGDPIKSGPFVGYRPIVYSPTGDPGIQGGRIIGYVVDTKSNKNAYEVMCEACEAYNDKKNQE